MSRVKTIGGLTVLSLVFLGVLAALAQTAQKPPTELYVRTTPPGAAVFVDDKKVGTSPSLLEVEPGDHSITVKLDGHQPRTRKVTVREGRIRRVILELQRQPKARDQKLEAVARKTAWGEAVEGVQLKAYAEKPIWIAGDTPALRADMRNTGGNRFKKLVLYCDCWELELDGRWYKATVLPWGIAKVLPFGPGTRQTGLVVPLWEHLVWRSKDGNKPLQFLPGRHTIRVAFCLSGMQESEMSDVHTRRGPEARKERVVSRAMQVEVRPESADQPAWGPAVEGVQCRIRVEKPTWRQGTVPKLLADLRNRGKRNLRIDIEYESWEIEIDGKWHRTDGWFSGKRRQLPLGPGQQQQDLEVSIYGDGNLAQRLRVLQPGKHTLRVARLLNSSTPGEEILRLVSNPIEIEIVPAEARPKAPDQEQAWGKQVENLQCRIRAEKAAWTAGTVPKLFGDLRSMDVHPILSSASENWEIEIDGKWHKNQRAKLLRSHRYKLLRISADSTEHDVREVVYQLAIDAEQSAARSLRALAPGKHVLRAGYRFGAFPPDTAEVMSALQNVMGPHRFSRSGKAVHVVSNPIEIEILPAEPTAEPEKTTWGPAVEGVQIRLWAEKKTWRVDEDVILKADLRNRGERDFRVHRAAETFALEVDGKWHTPRDFPKVPLSPFGPGREYPGIQVQLQKYSTRARDVRDLSQLYTLGPRPPVYGIVFGPEGPGIDPEPTAKDKPLELSPGKHTIRLALRALPKNVYDFVKMKHPPLSNPVEIEVVPAEPTTEAEKGTWGPVVEGVQVRLWAEKKTWRVDEEVILKVDCRNQGKRDLMLDDRTGCFDVYVDHRKYSPDPNTTYLCFPAPFGPGRHYDGRPVGLGRYPGLKLAPGKHTIRVVLKAAQNTVRPVEGASGGTTMNKDVLEAIAQEIEKRRSQNKGELEVIAQEMEKRGSQPPVVFSSNPIQLDAIAQEIEKRRWQPPVVVSSNPIEIEIVAAKPTTGAGVSGKRKLSPRKLFSTSHGAGAGVLAVAFSPDGLTVAAVDEQGKITLCDARSGTQRWGRAVLTPEEKKRLLYEDRKGRIHTGAIAFSHDGYTLAVAADPVVRLYDAQSGRLLRTLQDKVLAVKLRDLNGPPAAVSRELELLEAVPHAHGRVYSVAFSPDGKLLATSGSHLIRADGSSVISAEVATPGKLKLWDAKTGELKQDLGEHYSAVRSVAFSGDGKTLASIGSHRPSWSRSVRLWDPQKGAVKSVLPIARGGGPEGPIAFSPDGKLVAAGALVSEPDPGDGIERLGRGSCRLLVWNAGTGALLLNHRTAGLVTSLSFSADSKTLAAGVDGQGVTLWDPETLTQKGQIQPSTDSPREVQVAFSPIGNLLAVGTKSKKRGLLTVWEIDQPGDQAAAAAKRFLAALAARDVAQMQSLIVETPPSWTADAMPGLTKELRDEVYVDIPNRLTEIRETLVRDDWAAVRIDDPKGAQGSYMWVILRRGPDGWCVCYMDDSDPKTTLESRLKEFISRDGDKQPSKPEQGGDPAPRREQEGDPVEESIPEEESLPTEESVPVAEVLGRFSPRKWFSASHDADVGILAVTFSPDGKTVAAVDEAAKVILYNARKPTQTASYGDTGGLGRRIMSLDLLTPDEKKLLLNKDRPQQIHSGAVAFSPDGKTLAVGGGPVVKLLDAATGRLQLALEDKQLIEVIKKLGGHSEQLDRLAAAPHAHGYVASVAFSPDGTLLATSGGHIIEASGAMPGQLKLWDAKTGELKRDLGEHFGAVRSVAFSPDGKILASAARHPPRWTSSVRSWDPQTGTVNSVLAIPRGDPWSVAFSPDGKLLAAGGIVAEGGDATSGMLLVWKARALTPLLHRPVPSLVASVALSADGKTLAAGEHGKGVTLWDPETGKPKGEIQPHTDVPGDLKGTVCVAFSPTGSLLAVGAENEKHGFLTVWDLGQPADRTTAIPPP